MTDDDDDDGAILLALLDDDDDDQDVEEDEEEPGWHVGDGGEAAAEQWSRVKESHRGQRHKSELIRPKGWS